MWKYLTGCVVATVLHYFLVARPLTDELVKANLELDRIRSKSVVVEGVNEKCGDWKMRIDCKDSSQAGWDFIYIKRGDNR